MYLLQHCLGLQALVMVVVCFIVIDLFSSFKFANTFADYWGFFTVESSGCFKPLFLYYDQFQSTF